jgi:hypothetical protein
VAQPESAARPFPRIPGYAWTWLQRTRPVVNELAARLTGGPPPAGFVDDLRGHVEADPFVRDVLVDTVADVAFGGRVPRRRPPGAAWDRGLTWWAAALAGTAPAAFEARSGPPVAAQHRLFDTVAGPADATRGAGAGAERIEATARRAARGVSPERAALAAALRELLATAGSDQVPASAIRQLLVELETDGEG